MRIRNFRVREQIMQQRIKRILADQKKHPENYLDLSEYLFATSTTQAATGQLTIQDLQRLVATLPDEMRAGEQQSIFERSYYQPTILRTPWKMPIGGVL